MVLHFGFFLFLDSELINLKFSYIYMAIVFGVLSKHELFCWVSVLNMDIDHSYVHTYIGI